jgi:hypothetical protein
VLNQAKGFAGTQYFQLRQKDLDAKLSYSKIISLDPSVELNISSIFPNPFKEEVNIRYQANEQSKLSIMSMAGEQLFSIELLPNSNGIYTLNLKQLPAGLYILLLQNSNGQVAYKLLKEQ